MPDSELDSLFRDARFADAEVLLRRRLTAQPEDRMTRYNLALAMARQGRPAEALEALQDLLRKGEAESHVLRTAVQLLLALRRPHEAVPMAKALLRRQGDSVEPHLHLALALRLSGKFAAAERAARQALRLAPESGEAIAELGIVLLERGRREEAGALLARAVALTKGNEPRQRALSDLLIVAGRPEQALTAYKAMATRKDGSPDAWVGVLRSARLSLDWAAEDEAMEHLREALADPRKGFWLPTELALYFPFTAEELLAIGRRHAARLQRAAPGPVLPAAPRPADPRLRVAYVLPDLRSAWDRLGPLFQAHDHRPFAFAAFAFNPDDGSLACQQAQAAFDHVTFLPSANEDETAAAIAAWAPDILVDLGGYRPEARPGALRRAPATARLLWLGMAGTSGAPWMQGIVADAVALPATLETAFSERVLRLPRCFQPAVALTGLPRPGRASLGLPEDAVVLAAFHDPRSFDRESFQLWIRILRQSEKAVLWLASPGRPGQERLRARCVQSGVAADRLVFAPSLPWRAHLARLQQADLALDTLVFGAQSGAGDALGQGVPFLTVAGSTLQTRIAASAVAELGLPELAAPTPAAMEELAVALVADPAHLAALKARLRARLPKARLFDVQGFAADLEQLYLGLDPRLAAPR